jgi:hypothetical protein
MVSPGLEAVYTGETSAEAISARGWPISRFTDAQGRVYEKWSVWTWRGEPSQWDEEIRRTNAMQERLGPLDDNTRQIRAHNGSLVLCEPGVSVTIDDLASAPSWCACIPGNGLPSSRCPVRGQNTGPTTRGCGPRTGSDGAIVGHLRYSRTAPPRDLV